MDTSEIDVQEIASKIYLIRGHKVMLDSDLAAIYGVTTFNLNKAVKRNLNRFPSDFMFQLSNQEVKNLIFQIGISSLAQHGGRRSAPYVFTQEGVAMLSSTLKSERAIHVNITIMRAFVKLRDLTIGSAKFIEKIDQLEKKYDYKFKVIFDVIRELTSTHSVPRKRIIGLGPNVLKPPK